jgi:hypothetical protein
MESWLECHQVLVTLQNEWEIPLCDVVPPCQQNGDHVYYDIFGRLGFWTCFYCGQLGPILKGFLSKSVCFSSGMRGSMALKMLLCWWYDMSILRAPDPLIPGEKHIHLLVVLFPANPTQQWGIQGLRCGARRPFLPVVAMVEMDVVGYLWWELTSACICSRNTTQFLQNRGQNFFRLKLEVMPGHAFYILGYRSYTVFRHGFDWPKSCLNRLDEF